jgi:rare lipoprotein A
MKNRLQVLLLPVFVLLCSSTLIAQEFGIASVYQDKFHGKTTAYGRTYNRNELVAAHKKHLPGTFLKVTRLDNKKTVTVEVIDRGPFVKGRIIDLSSRAARELGMLDDGVANVKLEVLQKGKPVIETIPDESAAQSERVIPRTFEEEGRSRERISTDSREATAGTPTEEKKPATSSTPAATPPKEETLTSKGAETPAEQKAGEVIVGRSFTFYDLYKLEVKKADKANFGVQVAFMSNFESLLKQVSVLQAQKQNDIFFFMEKNGEGAVGYKVILGPSETEDQAKKIHDDLSRKGVRGFVVKAEENYDPNALYKVQLKKPATTNFGVQVSSLTNEEGVLKQVSDLQAKSFDNTLVNIEKAEEGSTVFKVILGPFDTEGQASSYKNNLSRRYQIKGFVVPLN